MSSGSEPAAKAGRRPVRTGIRRLDWQGTRLLLDAHAHLDRRPLPVRFSALHRLQLRPLRELRPGERADAATATAWGRPVRRRDLTAAMWKAPVSYDWAGFRAGLDVKRLLAAATEREQQWAVVVQVLSPWGLRGVHLAHPTPDAALRPAHLLVDDVVVAPGYAAGGVLRLRVRRAAVVVHQVELDADRVLVSGRFAGADRPKRLAWSADDGRQVGLDLDDQPGSRFTATAPLRALAGGEQRWTLRYGDDTQAGWPCAVTPGLLRTDRAAGLVASAGERGELRLSVGQAVPLLTAAEVTTERVGLTGLAGAGTPAAALLLRHEDGTELRLPVRPGGAGWRAELPARAEPPAVSAADLHPGVWKVSTEPAVGPGSAPVRVRVARTAFDGQAAAPTLAGRVVECRAGSDDLLTLRVDASGDPRDRGAYRRRVNRLRYRLYRRLPLQDVVLFESWRAKQFSDSPREIYEQLRLSHPGLRAVWAVVDHAVETPEGVQTVVRFGRDYNRALGRARWVVANDSMVPWYRKRSGSTYLQTWHGTPLKRIGFDVADLQIANRNYLAEFGADVAKWDYLVSPNRFCTEVLPQAFRYGGTVLETGYPRNDVLLDPTRAAGRAAAARRRLDLPPDGRVLLYAPTWRENRRDDRGRYRFDLELDLALLRQRLGPGWTVLVRGHHLLSGQVRLEPAGGFVRNVSRYPDIVDLYLLADAVVTDYSSVMFDFAVTGRPMLFFTPDLESYRDDLRGFYLDFEAEAPGPLLRTSAELADALGRLDQVRAEYDERYQRFRRRFCGLEDGAAGRRVVQAVWGPPGSR